MAMKTKARSKSKRTAGKRKTVRSRKAAGPKKSIENRDLNEDEQEQITNEDEQRQITNVDRDDEFASAPENNSQSTGFTVDEEEEREKRRKLEDLHPEEPMK